MAARTDLMSMPVVGAALRRRGTRTAARALGLVVSLVMIAHGLFGPTLAPKNLATVLGWVQVRGLLVLALLVAGNVFCAACPFMLVRDWARRLVAPARLWPRALRTKWPAIALFVIVLFAYELFDLWSSPWWTAWLVVAYFAGAVLVDSVFKGATFCKYLCPIGQFNFVASTVSPLEVAVREPAVCDACHTKDCIRGRRDPADRLVVLRRGCELALFQPLKVGNFDCTFCLDCVYACPHDNVGVVTRTPAAEIAPDVRRSGIGRFSRRTDVGALALVFTFGALLNAFGMVSPIYAVESWLASRLGTAHEAPVLAIVFAVALVAEPLVLVVGAAWLTQRIAARSTPVLEIASRYAMALAPFGLGVWLAHYGFHFLTGLLTVVPVAQNALAELGAPVLGAPRWGLVGLPVAWVYPIEIGLLGLGTLGTLLVAHEISTELAPTRAGRALAPWVVVCGLLVLAALWLLSQPMEMRGTILAA